MDALEFVQNVKKLCAERGTNPTAACEASGAGRNFMDNIKKGSIPSVVKVQMLADYLGVTTSELLGEAPSANSSPADEEAAAVARAYKNAAPEIQGAVRRVLSMDG